MKGLSRKTYALTMGVSARHWTQGWYNENCDNLGCQVGIRVGVQQTTVCENLASGARYSVVLDEIPNRPLDLYLNSAAGLLRVLGRTVFPERGGGDVGHQRQLIAATG